jgi:hypothetical protein
MNAALLSPSLIGDFAEFLSTRPSREQILEWHPSAAVVERFCELLARQKEEAIAPDEMEELESFVSSETVLNLLKAKLRSQTRSEP